MMLEKIRSRSHGNLIKGIIFLIVLVFGGFFGVHGYMSGGGEDAVAMVNGKKIHRNVYNTYYQNIIKSYPNIQMGTWLEQQILDSLVTREVITSYLRDTGYYVNQQQVINWVKSQKEFQQAGSFSKQAFDQALQKQKVSEAGYLSQKAEDILLEQFHQMFTYSDIVLPYEVYDYIRLDKQTRDISYIEISKEKFKSGITVTEEEIREYYTENAQQFMTAEKVKLSYIEVKKSDFLNKVNPTEQAISDYYETNKESSYYQPEQRKLAHILINLDPTVKGKKADKAKKKIFEIKQQLDKGTAFSLLAKKYSEDESSAENKGGLGWFSVNDEFDPDFIKKAFELKVEGDISEPIRTQFGWHIILLEKRQKSAHKSLASVKQDIVEKLKQDLAVEKFEELQDALSESLFEGEVSLDELAKQSELTIKESRWIVRGQRSEDSQDLFNHPEVLTTAFSDPVIYEKANSELININEGHFMALRAKEYEPPKQKDRSIVEGKIREALKEKKTLAKVEEIEQVLLATIQKDKNAITTAGKKYAIAAVEKKKVSRTEKGMASAIIQQAFKQKINAPTNVTLPNGNRVILIVSNIENGKVILEPSAANKEITDYQNKVALMSKQNNLQLFISRLKENASIKVYEKSTLEEDTPF